MVSIINSNKKLVIPLIGAPGAKLTNTTYKQNLTDTRIQYSSVKAIFTRFLPDGIFPFMDLTVEAEALGLSIKFPENEPPSIINHPVKDIESLNIIRKSWKGISGRMNIFIDVVKKMAEELNTLKGAYVIGSFTLAGELMGVNDIAINTLLMPDLVKDVIDFSVEVISSYTSALFDAGADVVVVLEPTAVILSPAMYEEFSLKPFKKLLSNVGDKPLILHICGNTTHLVENMSKSGAVGLSLDSDVNFSEVIKKVPENIALIGNINPVKVIMQGTPPIVEKEVMELKDKMKDYENFILSSGCDIPFDTPLENIEAFMRAGRNS